MIKKIKFLILDNKKIVENFSYLSLIQIFNMLLPLITYPYLISILGLELYGTVIFAQVLATYFSILINFGFNVSATKDVSIYRDNPIKLSEIVSSVYIIKVILWFISLVILLITIYLMEFDTKKTLLYLFSFSICFNELMFAQWFFQGIEKMKFTTVINLVIRGSFVCFIFLFVKEKDDYLLVPLFNGIGAFIGGILTIYIIFYKENVKFNIVDTKKAFLYLKESFPLFASNVIISIKDRFNIVFIGMFIGMHGVLIYDIGVKIMALLMQPISIVNNAIYPKVAIEKNMNIVKKTMKYSFFIMLVGILILQPFISDIIELINKDIVDSTMPTRVLLIAPIVFSISFPLAHNCIVVFGKYKILLVGMLLTTLFYLMLILTGYLFNMLTNVTVFAVITVLVYSFELLYRYVICKKMNLI